MVLWAALALPACSGGRKLAASPQAQDANGTVEGHADANGTRLAIHVHGLALPNRLSPDATTYVVWVKAASGGEPRNIGRLSMKGEDGSLECTTQLRAFELFITAEPSPNNTEPWGEKLLWTQLAEGQ